MKLEEMKMAALLSLHNDIANKPAGPKTFQTKGKLIARIRQIASTQSIDLDALRQPKTATVPKQQEQSCTPAIEAACAAPKKVKKYAGVGRLTRRLLLEPSNLPYATIVERVKAKIPEAVTTVKTVWWYANKMRSEGIDVPKRRGMGTERAEQTAGK